MKGLNCGGTDNSAVTHTNPSDKKSINLSWKAPKLPSGSFKTIEFKFSAAKDFDTFWVAIPATNIVTVEGVESISSTTSTTTTSTTPKAEPESEPETESEPDTDSEPEGVTPEGESEGEAEGEVCKNYL